MNENNIQNRYRSRINNRKQYILFIWILSHWIYIYKIYIDKKRCHVFVYATAEAQEIIVEEQAEEEPERKLSDGDDDDDNSDTLIDNITKNGVEEEDDVEETITNNNADNEDIGLDEAIEQFAMSLSRIGDQLLCPICRSLYKNAARLPCMVV